MYKKKSLIGMLGWYGVVATVLAYILVSFSLVAPTNWFYQLLNFTGALGITIETYYKKDYQPFWLNFIWMLIAAVAIISIIIH
jgi:hypothetical protein